jgi:hypothetical protein
VTIFLVIPYGAVALSLSHNPYPVFRAQAKTAQEALSAVFAYKREYVKQPDSPVPLGEIFTVNGKKDVLVFDLHELHREATA